MIRQETKVGRQQTLRVGSTVLRMGVMSVLFFAAVSRFDDFGWNALSWQVWLGCAASYLLVSAGAAVVQHIDRKMWLGMLLGFFGVLIFAVTLKFGI